MGFPVEWEGSRSDAVTEGLILVAQPSGLRPGPPARAHPPLRCPRGPPCVGSNAPLFSGGARPRSSFPFGPSPEPRPLLRSSRPLLPAGRCVAAWRGLCSLGLVLFRTLRPQHRRGCCLDAEMNVDQLGGRARKRLAPGHSAGTWRLSLTCSAPASVLSSPPLPPWGLPPPPPLPLACTGPAPCCAGGAVALSRCGSETRAGCVRS